jgi:thiamine-phosphate pyrophosphorylase
MRPSIKDHSLYLVTSEEYSGGRPTLEIARSAISGGVDILQMREKRRPGEELLALGKELSGLCREKDVLFIVNDDPLIAMKVGAHGVHLGQEDAARYTLKGARQIVGEDRIIGISTHTFSQFKAANESDVDYIAFGPIFPTKTKDYYIGTGEISKVLEAAKKPVIFVGGIDLDNIDKILSKGAKNVALIRAITGAEDAEAAARAFKDKISGYKERGRE